MPPHETGSTATPGAPRATAPPPRTFGPQGPTLGDLSDAYLEDYQVRQFRSHSTARGRVAHLTAFFGRATRSAPPRPFASCDAAPRKDARASRHRITATGLGAAVAGHRPPRVPPKIPRRGSQGRTEPPSPTPRPQPGTRRAIPPPQPHQRPCPTQSPTSPRVAPVAGTRTGVRHSWRAGPPVGRSRRRSEIKRSSRKCELLDFESKRSGEHPAVWDLTAPLNTSWPWDIICLPSGSGWRVRDP